MELFNKSERVINGLKPNTTKNFSDDIAIKMLRLYKNEIVRVRNVQPDPLPEPLPELPKTRKGKRLKEKLDNLK